MTCTYTNTTQRETGTLLSVQYGMASWHTLCQLCFQQILCSGQSISGHQICVGLLFFSGINYSLRESHRTHRHFFKKKSSQYILFILVSYHYNHKFHDNGRTEGLQWSTLPFPHKWNNSYGWYVSKNNFINSKHCLLFLCSWSKIAWNQSDLDSTSTWFFC